MRWHDAILVRGTLLVPRGVLIHSRRICRIARVAALVVDTRIAEVVNEKITDPLEA